MNRHVNRSVQWKKHEFINEQIVLRNIQIQLY